MEATQTIFNWAVGIAGTLGGWWLKTMWEALKDLQNADKELTAKVSSIEVLVAGNYVTRNELTRTNQAILDKLDRIEDKLDGKVDKARI